jgi:hypothetical protein
MKSINFLILALILGTVMFTSTSCDPEEDGLTDLNFHFHPTVDSEDFSFSTVYEINGVATQFATAQFYVHGIELAYEDGSTKNIDDYLLVKAGQMMYSLGEVEEGTVNGIKFNVGVDTVNNAQTEENFTARSSDDPLSIQSPTMHWNWNAGYVFVKLEGMFDNDGDGTPETGFEYHIGKNEMLRNIDLTTSKEVMGESMELMLHVDYAKFLDGVDLKATPIIHGMSADFMDNIQGSFMIM